MRTHSKTAVAHGVQVVFDCLDPDALAGFYAKVLHYKLQDPPGGFKTWEEALKVWGIPQDDWNSADRDYRPGRQRA